MFEKFIDEIFKRKRNEHKEYKAMDEITDILIKYEIGDIEAYGIFWSMLESLKQAKLLGLKNLFKKENNNVKREDK